MKNMKKGGQSHKNNGHRILHVCLDDLKAFFWVVFNIKGNNFIKFVTHKIYLQTLDVKVMIQSATTVKKEKPRGDIWLRGKCNSSTY